MTHAEIRHTVFLKIVPTGSRIRGMVMKVVLMLSSSHSMRKQESE